MDWGLVGVILAPIFFITSVILSVFIALKFHKKRQPVWACNTKKVIGLGTDAPEELKLTFAGAQVNDVWRTTLILFNKGRESTDKSDVKVSPTVEFKGARILREPIILAASDDTIRFSASRVDGGKLDSIELGFEYLCHNDGGVVEVLHTEAQQITCSGTVKDAKDKTIAFIGEFVPYRPMGRIDILDILYPFVLLGGMTLVMVGSTRDNFAMMGPGGALIGAAIGYVTRASARKETPFFQRRKYPKWTSAVDA